LGVIATPVEIDARCARATVIDIFPVRNLFVAFRSYGLIPAPAILFIQRGSHTDATFYPHQAADP
jgi:hypothetical protein